MKIFKTFEKVDGMKECRKTATAHAKEMTEPFRVDTLEGNYTQGKPGDFLMRGIEGELYICDKSIFIQTYEWVK